MNKAIVFGNRYALHDIEAEALIPLGIKIDFVDETAPRPADRHLLTEAQLLFVRDACAGADVLARCPNLKGIVRYGVGYDTVDISTATARKIVVANIPDYGADIEVADQTLALFLGVARRVASRDADVRRGVWGVGQNEPMRRIGGSTLGLVGYGRIARAVHRRFASFGITDVVACDPYLESRQGKVEGVTLVGLDELAQRSDIISLHAPGGGRPIVDEAFLAKVRPHAILVNTSRGSNVDEATLAKALREKRLAGAGLDVLTTEPPDPANPLLTLRQVVLSDHAGWYSEESIQSLQRQAGEEAARILSGNRPKNWVNPW